VVVVSHPTGNTFVRALLAGLEKRGLLTTFHTTIGFSNSNPLPFGEAARRVYELPKTKLKTHMAREVVRLVASKAKLTGLTAHEKGWAAIDNVYRDLDARVAASLAQGGDVGQPSHVYAYEDGAAATFKRARDLGLRRVYDLPIAHWSTVRTLLREEAERYPEWEPTLQSTRDSEAKLQRKDEELGLAEWIICPSEFVARSLPPLQPTQTVVVAPFGSPPGSAERPARRHPKLRVLFAGTLSQRKGLADLFAALRLLKRPDVELIALGSAPMPLQFYHSQCAFTYESPRPHARALDLMRTCDLLVLPSIAEGRALVQQEAMSCGLPILVTANAGGEDLVIAGETGFIVPIRSPEAIAERLNWFADNRDALPQMGRSAQKRAAELTWDAYASRIISGIGLQGAN